jgi:hypothetical protein
MTSSIAITETGCYLDNHRGHYITRDAILLAQGLGFIVGEFERFALDHYDDLGHEEGYPQEALIELCDEAVAWLNNGQGERMPGQNFPPIIPEDHIWHFYDGDFGLYPIEELD